jgi:hypothetical protein
MNRWRACIAATIYERGLPHLLPTGFVFFMHAGRAPASRTFTVPSRSHFFFRVQYAFRLIDELGRNWLRS